MADQLLVPEAADIELAPCLYQVTFSTPLPLSDAVPLMVIELLMVVYGFVVGLVIVTVGAIVSTMILSLAPEETLPAAFLYQM